MYIIRIFISLPQSRKAAATSSSSIWNPRPNGLSGICPPSNALDCTLAGALSGLGNSSNYNHLNSNTLPNNSLTSTNLNNNINNNNNHNNNTSLNSFLNSGAGGLTTSGLLNGLGLSVADISALTSLTSMNSFNSSLNGVNNLNSLNGFNGLSCFADQSIGLGPGYNGLHSPAHTTSINGSIGECFFAGR